MIIIDKEEYHDRIGCVPPMNYLDVLKVPWSLVSFNKDNFDLEINKYIPKETSENLIIFRVLLNDNENYACCIIMSLQYNKEDLLNDLKRLIDMKAFI